MAALEKKTMEQKELVLGSVPAEALSGEDSEDAQEVVTQGVLYLCQLKAKNEQCVARVEEMRKELEEAKKSGEEREKELNETKSVNEKEVEEMRKELRKRRRIVKRRRMS